MRIRGWPGRLLQQLERLRGRDDRAAVEPRGSQPPSPPADRFHRARADDPQRPALLTSGLQEGSAPQRDPAASGQLGALLGGRRMADRARDREIAAPGSGGIPPAAPTPPLQKPAVSWTGGVQHNGNNPEVVDTVGRSYASRCFAPGGVPFARDGVPQPQQVFSSNKNLTGRACSTSLVLTNAGDEPMRLRVALDVAEPAAARASRTSEITIPGKGSVAIPVAQASDKAFTAFRASVEPLDQAAAQGRIHVDVVSHDRAADARTLMALPLMKTEGERGYRVPPERLREHPAYVEETRHVMAAAGVAPHPLTDRAAWPDARVQEWVASQRALGAAGRPTAFDPAEVPIQGRVNGLVAATGGAIEAQPFVAGAAGASAAVRLIPNRTPPEFAILDGTRARRPGSALRDAGAYGKALQATLPVTNPGATPITVSLALRAPPVGEDGAQLPGHQIYNGPLAVRAPGAVLENSVTRARVDQPAPGSTTNREHTIATLVIPPRSTVPVEVLLQVHANSQFPVDLVATRER